MLLLQSSFVTTSRAMDELGLGFCSEMLDKDVRFETQDRGLSFSLSGDVVALEAGDMFGIVSVGLDVVFSSACEGWAVPSRISSGPRVHRHSQRRLARF